jgi:hypothetical protein
MPILPHFNTFAGRHYETGTLTKQSWTRYFPRGAGLYSALAGAVGQPGAYQWIQTWGAGDGAERDL